MYNDLPNALPTPDLYILIAIVRKSKHAYAIADAIFELSLQMVQIKPKHVYARLSRLQQEGLIIKTDAPESTDDAKTRHLYAITNLGRLQLRAGANRMNHALIVLENLGLTKTIHDYALESLLVVKLSR